MTLNCKMNPARFLSITFVLHIIYVLYTLLFHPRLIVFFLQLDKFTNFIKQVFDIFYIHKPSLFPLLKECYKQNST